MKTNIGIGEKERMEVVKILNRNLSDLYVLLTKTRNYHWNVVGPRFNDLHKFFDEQYEQLNEAIDEVAERVRSLGGKTVATLKEFSRLTRLEEQPGKYPPADRMLARLLEDHEQVIRTLRQDVDDTNEKYHDVGTSDFLTGLMESHEKMAWMLRSFLEK